MPLNMNRVLLHAILIRKVIETAGVNCVDFYVLLSFY